MVFTGKEVAKLLCLLTHCSRVCAMERMSFKSSPAAQITKLVTGKHMMVQWSENWREQKLDPSTLWISQQTRSSLSLVERRNSSRWLYLIIMFLFCFFIVPWKWWVLGIQDFFASVYSITKFVSTYRWYVCSFNLSILSFPQNPPNLSASWNSRTNFDQLFQPVF